MARTTPQLSTLLERFYRNPVALVSFELFLSIGAILFLTIFAIRPTLLTMSDLVKQIEEKRRLQTQLTQKVVALNTAQESYNVSQNRLGVLEEAIPRGANLTYTLKVIEKLASDQSLMISNMTVLEVPQDPSAQLPLTELERLPMPIQLSVIGPYTNIREFAEQLRNSRRSFVIERITFSTQDARGQKTLEGTFLLNAPYFGVGKGENRR